MFKERHPHPDIVKRQSSNKNILLGFVVLVILGFVIPVIMPILIIAFMIGMPVLIIWTVFWRDRS